MENFTFNLANVAIGVAMIGFGIWFIKWTYKNPDSQLDSSDFKGYIGGFFLILFGVLVSLNLITF